MTRKVILNTPYPSLADIAKMYGLSQHAVERVEKRVSERIMGYSRSWGMHSTASALRRIEDLFSPFKRTRSVRNKRVRGVAKKRRVSTEKARVMTGRIETIGRVRILRASPSDIARQGEASRGTRSLGDIGLA